MTSPPPRPKIEAPDPEALDLSLPPLPLQLNKVVLVMDLVESVRLMAAHEVSVVMLWHGFLQHAQGNVLPRFGGRLVKSLGDGILAEFDQAGAAVQCALALQRYFDPVNHDREPEEQLLLRAGLHATHIYVDANDVYGHGVNLAARVAGLAAPGETVVTAQVRDAIVDGIDGDLHDMGENYLKHWPEPVRTWSVQPAQQHTPSRADHGKGAAPSDFRPSIAVIPFESRSHDPGQLVIGELIADGVITQLARSQDLRVISRLSTTAFRGRAASPEEIDARLDTSFVLSGSYATLGSRLVIMAELCDTRRHEIVWADRLTGDIDDLMLDQSELLHTLALACAQQLLQSEVQRSLTLALPRLDSNELMLGGITLMHRSTKGALLRSRALLEAVTERHKRVSAPWAWLAKWHIMQVVQGLTNDPSKDFQQAIELADRALDLEPNSSLAMAVKGHALCHLGSDVDSSRHLLDGATQINPNDPIAWLYAGFWSSMWGDAHDAVDASERALRLSPLDPQRYYLQMLAANSYLAAGRLTESIQLSQSSLRTNRYHLPTLRALMAAQFEAGQTDEARATLQRLRMVQPDLTLEKYRSYGKASGLRSRIYMAMESLGLPKQ
jgi:adenylate cyclase